MRWWTTARTLCQGRAASPRRQAGVVALVSLTVLAVSLVPTTVAARTSTHSVAVTGTTDVAALASHGYFIMVGAGPSTPQARTGDVTSADGDLHFESSLSDRMKGAQGSARVRTSASYDVDGHLGEFVISGKLTGAGSATKSSFRINCSAPGPTCTGGYPSLNINGLLRVDIELSAMTPYELVFRPNAATSDPHGCAEATLTLDDTLGNVVRRTRQAGRDCDAPGRMNGRLSGMLAPGRQHLQVHVGGGVDDHYLGRTIGFSVGAAVTLVLHAPCTIEGTPDGDLIPGTDGPDVICGLGGNDTIKGGSGDDTIWGGPGNDRLFGEGGSDQLVGEDGDDLLCGNDGADFLDEGNGNGTLVGGDGDDFLFGVAGRDRLYGDAFRDNREATTCGDQLSFIVGGADELFGGAGRDLAFGGPDNDRLVMKDGIAEVVNGGKGRKDSAKVDRTDRVSGVEIRS